MPVYLRFVKGIIDSEDLPLNMSREILQHNMILDKIRKSSVKKVLTELAKMQKDDRDKYIKFYKEFGRPVKEGLYQDFENRDKLTDLVMFKSTRVEGYTSFAEYVERMGKDQKSIYYITGTKEHDLRESPLLEMYKEKDLEVLIMDDEIDEIILTSIPKYKDFDLKSVNRSGSADELKTDDDKKQEEDIAPVVEKVKKSLGELVKDVKPSIRLSDSPSCIVADENDPTAQMQHIMKMMGQNNPMEVKPILEINPKSTIVKSLGTIEDQARIDDISRLLLDQAMLLEGVELKSLPDFVKRMNRVIENGEKGVTDFLLEQGVTKEDIEWGKKYNQALKTHRDNDELDDQELEMVAGGKGCIGHSVDEKGVGVCLLAHNIVGEIEVKPGSSACIIADVWVENPPQ
jgi:molecular chaperone HtpG